MLASHKMLSSLMKQPHSKYIRKAYNSTAKKKKKKNSLTKNWAENKQKKTRAEDLNFTSGYLPK